MVPLSSLISRCRTLYEAEAGGSSVRYTDEEIQLYANEGLECLAEATGFYERYCTIPVDTRTYYDLRGFTPETVVRIKSVWSTARNDWLWPKDSTHLADPVWEQAVGSPTHFCTRGIFWLGVYPQSDGTDAGYLRVYFSGIPSRFANTQAVLSDLPDSYYPALEEYVLYEMCANDGRPKSAIDHFQRYLTRESDLHRRVTARLEHSTAGRIGGMRGRA